MNKKKIAAILVGLMLLPNVKITVEAAGVTVPTDVRTLADSLKKEEIEKETREKAQAEAKKAVTKLRQEKALLDKQEYIRATDPRLAQRKQLMAEQAALAALRVVELLATVAIVADEDEPLLQRFGQRPAPGPGAQVDFAGIA